MQAADTKAMIWPALRYADAQGAIEFLCKAFGFETSLVVPDATDESLVVHAELIWPLGGGIMLGSTHHTEGVHAELASGTASTYVVTDEPDALFERATDAGAVVAQGLRDEEYGSRGFTVRDPEGNHWSFGTYRGA
jgi:uncharacterized glyoxalase superfamily protein PhnB